MAIEIGKNSSLEDLIKTYMAQLDSDGRSLVSRLLGSCDGQIYFVWNPEIKAWEIHSADVKKVETNR